MAKKTKQPYWLMFNVENYRAQTGDLTTIAHGALLLLRLHYWYCGPIRNNDATLAQVCSLSASEWRRVRPTLERFFEIDDQWINREWDVDLEDAFSRVQKKSAAGKKGNEARWGNRTSAAQNPHEQHRTAIPLRSDCDPDAIHNYKYTETAPSQGEGLAPLHHEIVGADDEF